MRGSLPLRLDSADELLRGDPIELRQLQQVRGTGIGGAVFPFAHRLAADAKALCHEFLGHAAAGAVVLQNLAQGAAEDFLLLALGVAVYVFAQCPEHQGHQPDEHGYEKDHQRQHEQRQGDYEENSDFHMVPSFPLDGSIIPQTIGCGKKPWRNFWLQRGKV